MKQPYNTALYMRLSRDDANFGDSVSIETQRTILRRFASENNLHVVGEYVDMKTPSLIQFNDLRRLAGRGGKLRGQGG